MSFKTTPEQDAIINYTGSLLVVKAFAGTGKTSTLINYAKKNKDKKLLYIAFNRAIRDEASQKFPKNVDCKTAHQIAYAVYGKKYKHKLSAAFPRYEISERFPFVPSQQISLICSTLNHFLSSSDKTILTGHVKDDDNNPHFLTLPMDHELLNREEIVSYAIRIWDAMIDENDDMPITHDGYLKLYQLSEPDLSLSYNGIMLDEAQDITPVINSIVLPQPVSLIYVGDPHQQIYRWRGAENAMNYTVLKKADHLSLTNSFRFGSKIAMLANAILEFKGENLNIVGRGRRDFILTTLPENTSHYTIISRTVADVLTNAFLAANENKKMYWVGGIKGYPLNDMLDLYWFSLNKLGLIKNQELLNRFGSFEHYEAEAEETENFEMLRNINFLKEFDNLDKMLHKIQELTVTNEEEADVTLTTAHRSKGLEWETVMISEDFKSLAFLANRPEELEDELNLLYVAATRSTKNLIPNDSMKKILATIIQRRNNR